jgi:hypothetical protein
MITIGLSHTLLQLRKDGFAALTEARGMAIRCRSGLLWITAECDRRDYVLRAGESLEIFTRGRVVIEAERDSEVQLLQQDRDTGIREGARTATAALAR